MRRSSAHGNMTVEDEIDGRRPAEGSPTAEGCPPRVFDDEVPRAGRGGSMTNDDGFPQTSSDTLVTVETKSWFSRIGSALTGLLIGPLVVVSACSLP